MTHHLEPTQPHASPCPALVAISEWIGEVLIQLNAFAAQVPTDEFLPPSIRSIEEAQALCQELARRSCPRPKIVPDEHSGIVLEWHGEDGAVSVHIDLMGACMGTVYSQEGPAIEGRRRPDAHWVMARLSGVL